MELKVIKEILVKAIQQSRQKFYTVTEVIHDTVPSSRVKHLPEKYNQNILLPPKLSLEENNKVMKKLNIFQNYIIWKLNLTEDELIEKHAKHFGFCRRNCLLPYDYEFTCFSGGYNLIKRKHELSKIQRKKIINGLKYAELKLFCISTDVCKIYE